MTKGLAFCVSILCLLSCDSTDRVGTERVVQDSAGIRIVEYRGAPSGTHSITFASEPLYRHGHSKGDHLFEVITLGVLLPNGGAVIADGYQEVVMLGPDGAFLSVLARAGRGPGEVNGVRSIHAFESDTVLVEDDGNGQFLFFLNGALETSFSTLPDFSVTNGLMVSGRDSSGRLLMNTSGFRPRFDGTWLQGHMVRFDLETGIADTVAQYDMVLSFPRESPANPFAPMGIALASGPMFVYGRSDRPQVTWRSHTGAVRQIVRWMPPRRYPTDEDWELFAVGLRSDLKRVNPGHSDGDIALLVERQLTRYEPTSQEPLPLVGSIHSDGEGGIWMGAYVGGGLQAPVPQYTLVASNGEWLGTVQAPPGFRILHVDKGKVLGVLKDDLDVESVAVYEVTITPLDL